MTETRTPRARVRPHTNHQQAESRSVGEPTSVSADVSHKPSSARQAVLTQAGIIMGRVTISDGVTLNMGNYNSFRREVGLELDVVLGPPEGDELTEAQEAKLTQAHDRAKKWVAEKIEDAIGEANEFFEGIR